MTTPRTDITRKGRWAVVGEGLVGDEFVSQHNTDIEAVEHASNWSAANAGKVARIEPPYYDVRVLVDPALDSDSDTTTDTTTEPVPETDTTTDTTTETDPEPTTDTTTEPEVMSIDMASIPSALTVGQRVSVPVTGIAESETIYFHLFDTEWGNLVRSNVIVTAGQVELLIPDVSGDRVLQLQYKTEYKAKKSVVVSATATTSGDTVDPVAEVGPEPTTDTTTDPQTPSDDTEKPQLTPGLGWTGPIETPAQIGERHERVIAHWNIVPEQAVSDGFTVGVIAHHLDGIDRVEIGANGGTWVSITEPSSNPRTQCEEYWTALDTSGHDGPVTLRAIAYPTQGQPAVLGDLTLYTSQVGAVLELPAGRHELPPQALPEKGWLTVRPAPGVAREDVVIFGKSRYWKGGNLHIQGVTWETPYGGGMCVGDPNDGSFKRVWFEDCDIKGRPETWWLASMFSESFYTDTKITNTQNVWNRAGKMLVRNVHIGRVYEDVIRSAGGLFVNLKVDRIDRGEYTTYHSDFLQAQRAGNLILQDVEVPSNEGQGIFPETLTDAAFVRVNITSTSHGKALQLMGTTQNVLFKDSIYDGGANLRDDQSFNVPEGERLLFNNVTAGRNPPYLPDGWDLPNVYVIPLPLL